MTLSDKTIIIFRENIMSTQVPVHAWNNAGKGTWGLPPPVKLERRQITYTVSVWRKTQSDKQNSGGHSMTPCGMPMFCMDVAVDFGQHWSLGLIQSLWARSPLKRVVGRLRVITSCCIILFYLYNVCNRIKPIYQIVLVYCTI
jgi:hypothetical protein